VHSTISAINKTELGNNSQNYELLVPPTDTTFVSAVINFFVFITNDRYCRLPCRTETRVPISFLGQKNRFTKLSTIEIH
jgi:hypothetical protein